MGVNIWYKCITVTTLLGFSMIKKSVVIPIYSECKLLIFTTHTHTHTHTKKKASERVLREMLIILILGTNA